MKIGLTRRIWLTVASIVVFFTILVLYIVPSQQEKYFIKNFNQEVENLAKTVALGVKIALTEQNFEGVQTALDFAKADSRLNFVALVQVDSIANADGNGYTIERDVLNIYPDNLEINPDMASSDTLIVKRAPFDIDMMHGEVLAGFNTGEIQENMNRIRMVAIVVSIIVFVFGIFLGLWLARTISAPVLAIRDAAIRVGQGDLSQKLSTRSKDEIGELTVAFNKMVDDLSGAEEKIRQKNMALLQTLEDLEEKNELLGVEKKRSDELLLNILPEETAEELKRFGRSNPTLFNQVTVMFIDFCGFTQVAEQLTASELVHELDYCFREFDRIITDYDLEKIKTIGDAYLCVGGLPTPTRTHAKDSINAALEIQEFLTEYFSKRTGLHKPGFRARIGINSGSVVAGIVGVKKFQYDIWGDTVNMAARMEQSGEAGKVNISEATYALVKDQFNCTYRGKVQAKNKGEVDMYFIEQALQEAHALSV